MGSSRRDKEGSDDTVLSIRVQPRASRNEASFLEDGSLKVRLTAPPVDNAANEALVRFLASVLGVPRVAIEIVSGLTGRQKIVRIRGMASEDVRRQLIAGGK